MTIRPQLPRSSRSPRRALQALVPFTLLLWASGALAQPAGYEALGPPVTLGDAAAGSLLLATELDGVFLPAPGVETEATVRVTGVLARTTVRQSFHNPTDVWVEGVYVFPLPETAAVDTLRMRVGERRIEGRIHEREEAAEIYRRARDEGRRASLVEQERPNLFTTSVANLGPDETVEVTIEYQQELRYDSGIVSLRFPMVAAPLYAPQRPGTPLERLETELTAGLREVGARGLAEVVAGALPGSPVSVGDVDRLRAPRLPVARRPDGSPIRPVGLTVELDAGFAIDRIGSSSHGIDVVGAGRGRGAGFGGARSYPAYRVTLADAPVPADRDFVLEWAPAIGREPGAALFTEELGGETYALLLVMPPTVRRSASAAPPREAIFVIDTSGSMEGESIEQARAALHLALDRLRPDDHFNIVAFESTAEALFPASRPAGDRALGEARDWVDGLRADGGTEMRPALELAFAGRPVAGAVRQVVFITDGTVVTVDELLGVIRAGLGTSRLFTVGIGSAPNAYFMRRAAEEGRGTFTYIGRIQDVGPKMEELFVKLGSPVATGLELDWGDPGAEAWPERLPDLYAGEPLVAAARLPRGAGGEAVLQGWVGTRRFEARRPLGATLRDSEVTTGGVGDGDPTPSVGVARLWARRKIAALSEAGLDGVPHQEVRASVVEVALRHHLVSQFTSLVAVDLTPARPAAEALRSRRLPVALPAGWDPSGFVGTLPQGGTPSRLLALVGIALLSLTGAAALRNRSSRRDGPGTARLVGIVAGEPPRNERRLNGRAS